MSAAGGDRPRRRRGPERGGQPPRTRRSAPRLADLGPIGEDEWAVADDDEPTLRRVLGPTALGSEMERLLRRPGWGERLGAGRVAAHWVEIVGPELATRCEPVRLAGRVLVIRAESAAWATQLRYLTTQLRERLDVVIGPGSVRDVRIVIGRMEASAKDGMGHHGDASGIPPASPGTPPGSSGTEDVT